MPKGQHCWHSPEQKIEIVQKYLGSSTKVETFCKNEGIAKSTLYKWVKIYNEANSTEVLLLISILFTNYININNQNKIGSNLK